MTQAKTKLHVVAGCSGEESSGETMLEAIENAGAIGVRARHGVLAVYADDRGGSVHLTKAQAQQLVAELQALIDTL